MRGQELYETVKKVWNDKSNLPALARACSVNHQIICAMLDSNGGNYYLRERKVLRFGVKKDVMTTEDEKGVMLVPEPPNETESIQYQILAERNSRDLKHTPPDIRTLIKGKLMETMIYLLWELMEKRRMDDEDKENCEDFDAAEAEEEEGRVKKFTGRREIIQQTTKGITSSNIVFCFVCWIKDDDAMFGVRFYVLD